MIGLYGLVKRPRDSKLNGWLTVEDDGGHGPPVDGLQEVVVEDIEVAEEVHLEDFEAVTHCGDYIYYTLT